MLVITRDIVIDDNEIEEKFIHSSGPGGQNVNKVATAVQLRFDVRTSASLPEHIRERLLRLPASRLTSDGILFITAKRYRTQEKNREDARQRLISIIQKATLIQKKRKPTKPTKASQMRRIEQKRLQGKRKQSRSSFGKDEE